MEHPEEVAAPCRPKTPTRRRLSAPRVFDVKKLSTERRPERRHSEAVEPPDELKARPCSPPPLPMPREEKPAAVRAQEPAPVDAAAAHLRLDATGFGMRLDCAVEAKEEGAAARVQRRELPVAIEGSSVLPSTGGAIQWKKRDAAHAAPSPNAVDPYRLLCCRPDATEPELRRGYLAQAQQCRPRATASREDAAARAAQLETLSGCFTILTSPLLRAQYDCGEFELTRLADERKDAFDTDWCAPWDDDEEAGGEGAPKPEWARDLYEWTARWKSSSTDP